MRDSGPISTVRPCGFRLAVGALLIPQFDSCWIVNQIAPRQLAAVSNDDRRLSAISKDRSWRTRFWSWFPLARRPMIILMEKRIWRLEEGYVQTRVSSPMQSVTHLRAYLDEKGFKTAMIDDNLIISPSRVTTLAGGR